MPPGWNKPGRWSSEARRGHAENAEEATPECETRTLDVLTGKEAIPNLTSWPGKRDGSSSTMSIVEDKNLKKAYRTAAQPSRRR